MLFVLFNHYINRVFGNVYGYIAVFVRGEVCPNAVDVIVNCLD